MHSLTQSAAGRWLVSAVVAVLAVAAVLSLFRLPAISAPQVSVPRPLLTLQTFSGANTASDEKNLLTDPTPLFLPTKWNAAQKITVNAEAPRKLTDYPPTFSGSSPEQILPPPVTVPASPLEVDAPTPPLYGFGRHDVEIPSLKPRGAFLEIVAEGTGRKVLSRALPDAAPPGENAWQLTRRESLQHWSRRSRRGMRKWTAIFSVISRKPFASDSVWRRGFIASPSARRFMRESANLLLTVKTANCTFSPLFRFLALSSGLPR